MVPTKNKAEVGTRSNVVHITVQSAASDTGSLMFTQNPTGGTLNNGRGVTALSFNAIAQNESIGISELAFKVTTTGNIDLDQVTLVHNNSVAIATGFVNGDEIRFIFDTIVLPKGGAATFGLSMDIAGVNEIGEGIVVQLADFKARGEISAENITSSTGTPLNTLSY